MLVNKYRKIISAITIKGLYTPDVPPPRLQIICMEKIFQAADWAGGFSRGM